MDPRRGSACCVDGTSFLFDFPPLVPRSLSKKERHSQEGAEIATVDAAKTFASIGAVSDGDGCANMSSSIASAEMGTPFVGREQQRQQVPIRGQAPSQPSNHLHGQRTGEGLVHGVQVKLPATPSSCLTSTSSTTWPEEEYALIKGRDPEEKDNNVFGSSDAIDVGTGTEEGVATRVGEATAREVIRLSCSGCGDGGSGSIDRGRSHGDDEGVTAATGVTLAEEEIGKLVTLRRAEVGGGGAVAESRQGGTEDLSENRAGFADIMGDGGDGTWKCGNSGRGCGSSSDVNMNSTMNAQRARTVKIWDPVQQLQLFFAVTSTATGKCSGTGEKTVIEPTAGTAGVEAGFPPGSASGGVYGGGGSGSKPQSKTPVQPGRAAWCEDGETLFLLTHEGNLVKIKASANGDLSLLAIANLHGGASPATLQLTPEGDKLLVATATKGLCLVPSNDLDLSRAEMFGETFGMRGSKTRFWGAAVLGDVHGRGPDGSGKRSLTIIGNPSRSRDEKTDLFFFDSNGGQPERVDTPRREGVICLACSSLRPLLVFLCPTGEVYFREEVLKTDFPGPWYPSGYVLIDNNVDYLEAEDQLDTVVMTGPNGEELSKTQAHEVVVPWQHQAVSEEEASTGTRDEPVDIDGGGNTDVWAKAGPAELRWIPQDDDTWRSLGGQDEGSGCPGGSSRGGVQESCGGTLARLLGATPSILNESRKQFRAATASEEDAAVKRSKMVPKIMEILAAKKKKYDEEVFKRKRKLQESRAKAKRLKDKKAAAASAEEAALRAASEEAQREETAQTEEGGLRANAKATATGQGAVDDAAADVYEVVVDGKDTARELRPLLANRGDGGASKRREVAACESLPFGSAGSACGNLKPHGYHLSAAPAHDIGAPEYTPCIGSKSLVGPDVWCPPGGSNDTGVDSLPLTGGAAAYSTPWVPVASMAGKDHQGAAAYAAPTGASIDGSCSRSSLSTKRPGEMLWKPPASHASLSFSTSCSFSNLSGHLALKTNRHSGGDHGASSGPSGRRGAAGVAQEYCGPAGLQAEYAPASIGSPACPEAAGVMYGLATSQAGEAGRRWNKLAGTKGGCTAATTEVPLLADAREEASGGVSPFGGNASDRQRIPGEHGVCGVLYSGGLKHEPHSSTFPTDSPTDGRGGGYGSLDVGSGRHVAPSRAMQTVESTLSPFSPLLSDRRIPLPGASDSTPLYRGSSQRHCCSSQSSCLQHFASPSLGIQRPKTPSPPILLPHTFRGVSALTEALPSGRSDSPPTSSASSPECMRHRSAEMAVLPIESAGVSATPHNSWNQDLRRSMPGGANEGDEARSPRPGFKLLENVLSPQKDEPQRASDDGSQVSPSPDMTATVVDVARHQQMHSRGPSLYPGPHSLAAFRTIVDARAEGMPAEKTHLPSARSNRGHGQKHGNNNV